MNITQDASAGDFSLFASSGFSTITKGFNVSFTVFIGRTGGFTGAVCLSVSQLPAGATAQFSAQCTTATTAVMTIFTSGATPVGTFTPIVQGQNANVKRFVAAPFTVNDFSLSVNPSTIVIAPGDTASYQVTVNPVNGFSGPVTFGAQGFPGNTTSATFNPNPATGSSTLTVATNVSTALGSFPLDMSGQNENQFRPTGATLIVSNPPVASRYVPVTPCRIADTRLANGPFGGPFLTGGATREFDIPNSVCGIPSTALAYALNVTAVPKGALGYLKMWACGQTLPLTSNLNSLDGRNKAVAAIVPAGTNGGVCAFSNTDTDLVLDISGYFVSATNPDALAFYPITPCRISDTRNATGPFGGPALAANSPRSFPILSSACNVPAAAKAYSMNFTAVPHGPLVVLYAWPAGQPQPVASTLNAPTGAITANAAIVTAGVNGDVSVLAFNDSDLVIDINGYFAPPGPGGLSLFSLTPCRALDTRNPTGTPPFNGTLPVNVVASGCGAPASAQAFALNATVIPPSPMGVLTLWPNGAPQPPVSTLNALDGAITSNMAIVSTTNGWVNAFGSSPTHLVLDIQGYFAP